MAWSSWGKSWGGQDGGGGETMVVHADGVQVEVDQDPIVISSSASILSVSIPATSFSVEIDTNEAIVALDN